MAIAETAAVVTTTTASETAPMSPAAAKAGATIGPAARRGWLRRLVPREYLPRSRRWKPRAGVGGAAEAAGGGGVAGPSSYRRLASSLSRSLRWKRMPALPSLSLRAGSASAALDEVAFRVMYVVEAVVLGLALSCFFLCCGCHI
ncbi:hypothetical protein CFC21_009039 [Triticum aestivum]|uniref:Uncharacterized protein n=2 Tax=Triticum aestivum TaxID=4565 RepID=A0A3B5Z4M0_WHEAT|nr:uncharacterized protein LOC123146192 [Triticum aestivum]KAF6992000.1 hypothetical protein CFC21_009039 [Triticum aestivum]